jgi:hypothetical protein
VNWITTRPPYLGEGHKIKFTGNRPDFIFEGEVKASGLLVEVTAGPLPCLIGRRIQIRFGRVVEWQPLRAKMSITL